MFEARSERLDRERKRRYRDDDGSESTGYEADRDQGLQQQMATAEPGSDAAERMGERHDKLMEAMHDERDRQGENRYQQAKDEDYFDGLQWEPDDAQVLIDRGQAPLVFNKTKPTAEWLMGTEKRTRIDFKVLPRERDDEQGAEVKTKVLKYTNDVNRTAFYRSQAFKEMVLAGVSWLEDGCNTDPEADIIYSGHESWRNVYHDSRSRDLAYQIDPRYLFRQRALDLDIALAMFPAARSHLEMSSERADKLASADDDLWYLGERLTNSIEVETRRSFGERSAFVSTSYVDGGRRDVVRLLECWYRVPESMEFFANGPFAGKPVTLTDPQHMAAKQAKATTFNHVAMRMRCMIATEDAPLWDGPSWYRHNRFPFTPMWCYRRARDGMPYGIVRGIRDVQDDYNKRRSKALHVLSTNRIVADENAADDWEEVRSEAARADGIVLKKPGSDLEFQKPTAEVQGNLELLQHDELMFQDISGVQGELLGRQSNATSGKAIMARQEQGSMVTAGIFDNLRLAIQVQGEKQLSLVEQFYSEPKVLRIVGNRAPTEWLEINRVDPETGQVLNDITARQADFVVSEQDYRANLQAAAFEQISEMLTKVAPFAPQVVLNVLDLLIDLAEIPNKEQFVARIRAVTGQTDPSKPPTPEEQAARAQQSEKAAMAERIEMETLAAQLAKLKAEGARIGAQTVTEHVNALLQAINAGAQVVAAPHLAPVADEIASGAGWKDQAGQDPNIVQPPAQPMQPAAAGIPPPPMA